MKNKKRLSKEQGSVLIVSLFCLLLVVSLSVFYIDRSTIAYRQSRQNMEDAQVTAICEAGTQSELWSIWDPFRTTQKFVDMDTNLTGATEASPKSVTTQAVDDVGYFKSEVTEFVKDNNKPYERILTIRSTGWIDRDKNGLQGSHEPSKTTLTRYSITLNRSGVFDYVYFANNHGFATNFSPNSLIMNGDVRSNGDYTFTNGSGTFNGSITATFNDKLTPAAPGKVNQIPGKWSLSTYEGKRNSETWGPRMRPGYSASLAGAVGTSDFNRNRDLVFDPTFQLIDGRQFGSYMHDADGIRTWSDTSSTTLVDPIPSKELVMPNLIDIGSSSDAANINGSRFARSKAWVNNKATYLDGTANPNFSGASGAQSNTVSGSPNANYKGAYLDVWNSSTNKYQRLTTDGVVNSSILITGSSTYPIRIHGPVTIDGDVAIAGTIQGQGTIYAKRNIHIINDLKYKNPPDFRGSNMVDIDKATEKKDLVGLAANASIFIGNPTEYSDFAIDLMTPPKTKSRIDEQGNLIPAFNAFEIDSYGRQRYRSLLEYSNSSGWNNAKGDVNQIDAVMFANRYLGGEVGNSGGGCITNGSQISKERGISFRSTPAVMNYDNRLREREVPETPLIDIDLPRSPRFKKLMYQDLGFNAK